RLRLEHNNGFELLNSDADIEGIPDRQAARFLDKRTYGEYAVFWPTGNSEIHPEIAGKKWTQPTLVENKEEPAANGTANNGNAAANPGEARWKPATLHTTSARVTLAPAVPDDVTQIPGYVFLLPKATPEEAQNFSA